MKTPWVIIRKQWFLSTKDDWHDNYPDNTILVRVSEGFHPNRPYLRNLHLTLWGTGNFGLHRWVKANIFNVDRRRRSLIIEVNEMPETISIKWLLKHKFQYC